LAGPATGRERSEIGFIAEFLLQAALFRFAAVSVLHALAEPRLPGESQNVAVKITVLRGDERISAAWAALSKRAMATKSFLNIFIPDGWH
jgi:hypothetical protein